MTPLSNLLLKQGPTALLIMFVLYAAAGTASAQKLIEYDWEAKTRTACPAEVNRSHSGEVVITDINDILFRYRLSVEETPRTLNDWGNMSRLLNFPAATTRSTESGRRPTECETRLQRAQRILANLRDVVENDPSLPLGYKKEGGNKSVKLSKSLAAWARVETERASLDDAVTELATCTENDAPGVGEFKSAYRDIDRELEVLEKVARGRHELSRTLTIRPNTDYKVKVVESFEGVTTEGGEATFECKPESAQLTLSAGVLLSKMDNRTYEPRKVPGSEQNVLVVEGSSDFRPGGVALFNYLIPRLESESAGLALSAGPVINLGSDSDASSFGFFTGLSTHLFRRLYITPGFHFGEFADFPAGFNEGTPVPSDFGTLAPVKRWTSRFAFAITFRATDLSGFGGSSDEGEGQTETVNNRERNGRAKRRGKAELASSARGGESPAAEEFRTASYDSAPPAASDSLLRTAKLRSQDTANGSRVSIVADSALTDFTTFTSNNVLYIMLPRTKNIGTGELIGREFKSAKVEQNGNNLIVSLILPRGVTASVTQKFNRLEVSFITAVDVLATAPRE